MPESRPADCACPRVAIDSTSAAMKTSPGRSLGLTRRRRAGGDTRLHRATHGRRSANAFAGISPGRRANRRPGASTSSALRNRRDRLLVDLHLRRDALVRVTVYDREPLDAQVRGHDHACELVVFAQRSDLLGTAVELHVAVEPAVRPKQDDVELLDPAVLLHPAVEAEGVIEDLEPALLAAAHDS